MVLSDMMAKSWQRAWQRVRHELAIEQQQIKQVSLFQYEGQETSQTILSEILGITIANP